MLKPSKSAKPSASIPNTSNRSKRAKIVDGKVLIKKVELKGTSLFPQYGVTQQYVSGKLNEAYGKLDPWMSISDMHFLADTLTIAYHQKGLTFNQAFVVPNEIENNTLVINVLTGTVSEINLKNNKLYSEEQIKKPFIHLLGKVVYEPDIKTAMQQANSIPGLKVFGFFSMGNHPGQTRLNLHVLNENKHNYSIRADNYGVNDTGVYRVIGQYQRNNISGRGDILQGNLVSTNEVGNMYGGISYFLPIENSNQIGAAFYSNQFEVAGGFDVFGLNGHLTTIKGFWDKRLLAERNAIASLNQSISIKHSEIRSDSESHEINDILSENTDYFTYRPNLFASVIWPSGRQKQTLGVAFNIGYITKTDNEELDSAISALDLLYNHEFRWKSGHPSDFVTSIISKAHYTSGVLPSSERSVMTGPNAVRGYKPALFSADTVYSLTIEQSINTISAPGSLNVTPFFYFDSAYGIQNGVNEEDGSFAGFGFGANFQIRKTVSGNLTIGHPIDLHVDDSEEWEGVIIYGYIDVKL